MNIQQIKDDAKPFVTMMLGVLTVLMQFNMWATMGGVILVILGLILMMK